MVSKETDMEPSSTNVKEITVSIQHNSDNTDDKDSENNSLSKRTRANLVLNSKVIYPPGAKSASAFNQGVLKFQQLLELPLNESKIDSNELRNNGLGETLNNSIELDPEIRNITLTDGTEDKHSNCGNSTTHNENIEKNENGSSLKILKNKFLEDFGTSGEKILNLISNKDESDEENNSTETSNENLRNKTAEVEYVKPVTLKPNNSSANGTDDQKSSIEILDDDIEDSNSTDTSSNNSTRNSYLPAERKSSDSKVIEVKPQKLQEISLESSHTKSSRKEDIADDISQNIKRDILLGNLNPFFSNPSTNSIRNTNSIFFDDMLKKSGGLIGRMNPFVINSISFDGRSTTPSAPLFSRLRSTPTKTSGSVKTLKSIALSEDSTSSSFGSKTGGLSSSFNGFTNSLGSISSSSGTSFSSLGGQSSNFGGRSSKITVQSTRGNARGRRPNFSRFRNSPSKPSKATSVETVSSVPLGDGKKFGALNSAPSPSFGSQSSSVKTVPSLLIREEDESSKFSSKFQNKAPSAVSSASFTFTPSGSRSRSHGRTKSVSSFSKTKPQSSFGSFSKPKPSPIKSSDSEEGVEILKSVDYSLPEEVGKTLTKTGPSKFKRKAGFEPKIPDFSMQASVTVDPFMVNFDMSRKTQDNSINPYLVNTQMKAYKRKAEKSRRFEFTPSIPDRNTRQMKEFNKNLRKASYFQPSIQFQPMTESPQEEVEMFEVDYPSEEEKVEKIQSISNFESDILFKPYFSTQSPKKFHITKSKKNERPPRSFESPETNFFNTQSPRSFQMAEPSTYRYFGNVHMIDLSK